MAEELADCVIRIADVCGCYGLDLEAAIRAEVARNAGWPGLHGKLLCGKGALAVDVGWDDEGREELYAQSGTR